MVSGWKKTRWLYGLAMLPALHAHAKDEEGFWLVQTSVFTHHFSRSGEHSDRQRLIGLERNQPSGLIYGAATFRNSFEQRSYYAYAGKRFDIQDSPFYLKASAGLLHGYKGRYRDKIPLNRFGTAPAIIPSAGVSLGPLTGEVVLLGVSATLFNVGMRF